MNNILFFDIESSGLEVAKAKILTISFVKGDWNKTFKFDPGVPIPESASRVNGIWDKDVVGLGKFCDSSLEILEILNSCDYYGGYNLRSFDYPLLKVQMLKCGIDIEDKPIIDVYEIVQSLFKSLKLKDIYRTLLKKEFKAHQSHEDIMATRELYEYIIRNYFN